MITAIVLAGGTGSRVGADCPKQFVEVLGKPVIVYTLEIFEHNSNIDAIEVVCHKEWRNQLCDWTKQYNLTKVRWIVDGGETFQDSVMCGLKGIRSEMTKDDYVVIQYGAAPFTSDRIVNELIETMKIKQPVVSATPCFQLMGSNDGCNESHAWVDRDSITQIACPYGFKYSYLVDMYERAEMAGLLETIEPHTTSLIYALGDTIYLSYGDQTNIKITTKEDLDMFEGYAMLMRGRGER